MAFLGQLDRQLGAPFAVVWDRLQAHRAIAARDFLAEHPHVRRVFLPPYAPELNPIEYLWGHLKTNPLANGLKANSAPFVPFLVVRLVSFHEVFAPWSADSGA